MIDVDVLMSAFTDEASPAEVDWAMRPDVDAALDELEDASPRAAAVLGGALIEDLLDRLLAKALPNDSQAKLEAGEIDYFKKGLWALRIGLVSKFELRELRLLGRIRNHFAHSWSPDLHFGSSRVKDWIGSLETPNCLIQDVSSSGEHLIPQGDVAGYARENEKHRWLIAITQMMVRLLSRIDEAQKISVPPDPVVGD